MKINKDNVAVLNMELEKKGCCFRIGFCDDDLKNPKYMIIPSSEVFIDSTIINPNRAFYRFLDEFFAERDIELSYNNDGTIFWSKSGWDNMKGE